MTTAELRQFTRTIQDIIALNYAAGTPELISAQVKNAARLAGVDLGSARAEQKRIEKEIENRFVNERTSKSSNAQKEVAVFVAKEASGVANNITTEVLDIVRKSMRRGDDVQAELKRALRSAERYSRVVEQTATMALINEKNNRTAIQASRDGDPLMRYDGPIGATSRTFCREHVGQVKKLSEWREVKNQFDQSAAIFLGGWKCRHRFVPVL